jgi:hypothetical protein
VTFTDDDLKRFKIALEDWSMEGTAARATFENLGKRLLARLLNAENAILHHAHGDCECVQRWKISCGKKLDKSGIECRDD